MELLSYQEILLNFMSEKNMSETFVKNHPEMNFVSKGWGFEKWIVNKKEYCGKILYFAKGRKCSLHYHKLKDETFYVQSGKLLVLYSDESPETLERILQEKGKERLLDCLEKVYLYKGDNFYVPAQRSHMIVGMEDTELLEFSTQHFEEDSYRLIKGD